MFSYFLTRPIRMMSAAWHRTLGRLGYFVGSRTASRRHFERVLELRGDDFVAYVFLSRLAYDDGDIAGWRRECMHARRVAPARYAKLRLRLEPRGRFELFEPPASSGFRSGDLGDAGERAIWRTPLGSQGSGGEAYSNDSDLESFPPLLTASLLGRAWGDDFSSERERNKFCKLGRIRPEDILAVDLDELAQRLSRGTSADDDEGGHTDNPLRDSL